ncbi:phospholipase D-like domain-containing protein [Sporosarcina highlanderae]|uniref:Phosphatidylserine/phosphatidylglycerophosphate/ cardiolipin synthase family protein n=1 Tax=Sporosarcina highlanderae TaxID=3035916 RepID=A0ABT8JUF3_9BACL|nr:phosphatidylserine/phosphatidylglycerophosphate/cardiolipin synthase family protein [Sporosarcina highlanderae]MDN4608793.1 phosphatidylserine/phosphatidylglycerophosphate/cardiolipin synthase family protein [Sporosarcina highlanderae]
MPNNLNSSFPNVPSPKRASYPVRSGNALLPLVDGEPAFRRICEAIEQAEHSVWVTITFMWASCQMPDGRGTPLDVLNRAAARGLDVKIIFWRPDTETESLKTNAFWGAPEHFTKLIESNSTVSIRWDRAQPGYCQHQKSWLIDAGKPTETAFLGGINLNPHSVVQPGHRGKGQNHDVYIELKGPSAVDVHHNFVQRWNEASERYLSDGLWGQGSKYDLPFPTAIPEIAGDAFVQIQRTVHSGRYINGQAAPQANPFDIQSGEQSNFDQYCGAIKAARHSIYLEHQHIDVPEIVSNLRDALLRGVEVVAVVPAEGAMTTEFADLTAFNNFTLAGIAGMSDDGKRNPVWIHSKLMIVDGEWGTVGSCNLHRYSLFGNCEMNAAFWDKGTARTFLSELFREHIDHDISDLDHLAALQLFRETARDNRLRFEKGDLHWKGIAYELQPMILDESGNNKPVFKDKMVFS